MSISRLSRHIKRFEKNTSIEARLWANENVKTTTDKFLKEIDTNLYNESIKVINEIVIQSKKKSDIFNISIGGGGNYLLLYFLVRKFKPKIILETGVAAGWSTLAILKAMNKNELGKLYSSDFPYFREKNPEKFIGFLAQDEKNLSEWTLDIRGDEVVLPFFASKFHDNSIDFFHYDSDKSYSGRKKAMKILEKKFSKNSIIIFDDIQDNLHFKDFVTKNNLQFKIFEYEGSFIGLIGV